jgi:Na+/melibiose symporter-like transporter
LQTFNDLIPVYFAVGNYIITLSLFFTSITFHTVSVSENSYFFIRLMELTSRAKQLLLLAGTGCTMIGGLVLWKDAVAGKKIEEVKSEKEIKVFLRREGGGGVNCKA